MEKITFNGLCAYPQLCCAHTHHEYNPFSRTKGQQPFFSFSLPKTLILSLSLHFLFNFASNFTHFLRWQLISFFDFNILGLWKCVSSFLSIVFYEFFTFLSISLRGTYFLLSLFSFGFLMKMQVCAMSLILLYFEFWIFWNFWGSFCNFYKLGLYLKKVLWILGETCNFENSWEICNFEKLRANLQFLALYIYIQQPRKFFSSIT